MRLLRISSCAVMSTLTLTNPRAIGPNKNDHVVSPRGLDTEMWRPKRPYLPAILELGSAETSSIRVARVASSAASNPSKSDPPRPRSFPPTTIGTTSWGRSETSAPAQEHSFATTAADWWGIGKNTVSIQGDICVGTPEINREYAQAAEIQNETALQVVPAQFLLQASDRVCQR